MVSIRAPARGATWQKTLTTTRKPFRSAPPHGGRPPQRSRYQGDTSFDPRPRTGGDSPARRLCAGWKVSIRAPARGATRLPCSVFAGLLFRSAPPHGGRLAEKVSGMVLKCFDPRPRTGGDSGGTGGLATSGGFDPRPRTGGDVDAEVARIVQQLFRSAPPHGGRPGGGLPSSMDCQFRSAPPHGGRLPRAQKICT